MLLGLSAKKQTAYVTVNEKYPAMNTRHTTPNPEKNQTKLTAEIINVFTDNLNVVETLRTLITYRYISASTPYPSAKLFVILLKMVYP